MDDIKEILKFSEHKILNDDILKNTVIDLVKKYIKIDFGRGCAKCDVREGVFWLRNFYEKENNKKIYMNREFLLKDGIVVYVGYENTHYTNDNITDEKAVELLAKNPKLIGNFKKYTGKYNIKAQPVVTKQEVVAPVKPVIDLEGEKKLIQALVEKHSKQDLVELLKSKNIKFVVTDKKEVLAEKLVDNI